MFKTLELNTSTPHSHLGPTSAPQQGSLPVPTVGMGSLILVTDGFHSTFLSPPSSKGTFFAFIELKLLSRWLHQVGKECETMWEYRFHFQTGVEMIWFCQSHRPLFLLLRMKFDWQKREQTIDFESNVPSSMGKSLTMVLAGDRIGLFSSTVYDTLIFNILLVSTGKRIIHSL